jgi:hypothetical protein
LEAARRVIAVDGVLGFFGRGLPTRILANGLQGLMFSILWKSFLDLCEILLDRLTTTDLYFDRWDRKT